LNAGERSGYAPPFDLPSTLTFSPMPHSDRPTPLAGAGRDLRSNDVIFRMHHAARARRAQGADVIDSTLGALLHDDGSLAVLPASLQAMREVPADEAAAYSPLSGRPDLITAIERDVLPEGPPRHMATSVVTPGGTGAIYQAMVNFLEPGQTALAPELSWGPYGMLADRTGRRLDRFRTFEEDGAFDLEALERSLLRQAEDQGRILLLVNTPGQNPTGYTLTQDDWSGIAAAVEALPDHVPVTVLLDLAYLRYGLGPDAWWDAVDRILLRGTVLIAWTASKTFTQYGARIGALIALHPNAEAREEMNRAFDLTCRGTWSACNHAGQLGVLRLLEDEELRRASDRERGEFIDLLGDRWEAFSAAADAHGLHTPPWSGGFFTCVLCPDSHVMAHRLAERDVFTVPVSGGLRIALCATSADRMPDLASAVAETIRGVG